MGYSGSVGFSGSLSSISSTCLTRVAKVSNSCCWESIGVLGATVGVTVLRSSCLGNGSSVAGLLLEMLLCVTSNSLGAVRLGDTLVCVVRKEDT